MSIVYMAKRQIYPDQTKLFGPYDSREAALACVQDSLYPDAGEVIEVDLGKLQSTYTPILSYQDWELEETETYYHFSDGSTVIPKNWNNFVSIEVISRDDFDFYDYGWSESQSKEKKLVALMAFMISDDFQEVYCFRAKTPGALESLRASDRLEPFFKLRGRDDRAQLVDCARKAFESYAKGSDEGEILRDKFHQGISDFWYDVAELDDDLPDDWKQYFLLI